MYHEEWEPELPPRAISISDDPTPVDMVSRVSMIVLSILLVASLIGVIVGLAINGFPWVAILTWLVFWAVVILLLIILGLLLIFVLTRISRRK